jgi:hypothetical protein
MEITWLLVDQTGTPITGSAANTSLKVRRSADGYLLDWNDNTFKAFGWTTLATTLDEINATNLPGYYRKVMNISAWDDGIYQLIADYDDGAVVARGDSDLQVQTEQEIGAFLGAQVDANLDESVQAVLTAINGLNDITVGQLLAGDLGDGVSFPTGSLADVIRKLFWMMCGRLVITEASGAFTAFKTDGITPAASGSITDNGTATERSAPTWP